MTVYSWGWDCWDWRRMLLRWNVFWPGYRKWHSSRINTKYSYLYVNYSTIRDTICCLLRITVLPKSILIIELAVPLGFTRVWFKRNRWLMIYNTSVYTNNTFIGWPGLCVLELPFITREWSRLKEYQIAKGYHFARGYRESRWRAHVTL